MENLFSSLFKIFFAWTIINALLSGVFTNFFTSSDNDKATENNEIEGSLSYYKWKASWEDYHRNHYNGTTKVSEYNVKKSSNYRDNVDFSSWRDLYRKLYRYDKNKLDHVYKMFDRIIKNNSLNRREFLDVLISFVQNIEYKRPHDYGVIYDIYTPTEFMAYYEGDCDTRTVFLYTILKRYDYDVVILLSQKYEHSMIGVNISSSGKYKYHNGKRYYVWETTTPGFRLGMIPPDCHDLYYWNVLTL